MLHALNLRAYQMSFKQLGWATDVCTVHISILSEIYSKNIPDKKTKKNTPKKSSFGAQ